jgi:hypothetical protein
MKLEELVKTSINSDFPERMLEEKKEHSVEDKTFLSQVGKSIKQVNGHYSIGLPFRNTSVSLPNNMVQGLQRLECLKKKMLKTSQFGTDYTVFMNKLFEKDFVERVPVSHSNTGTLTALIFKLYNTTLNVSSYCKFYYAKHKVKSQELKR